MFLKGGVFILVALSQVLWYNPSRFNGGESGFYTPFRYFPFLSKGNLVGDFLATTRQ